VDMATYELCCDMIDVTTGRSLLIHWSHDIGFRKIFQKNYRIINFNIFRIYVIAKKAYLKKFSKLITFKIIALKKKI
jgi:hypothetical protein